VIMNSRRASRQSAECACAEVSESSGTRVLQDSFVLRANTLPTMEREHSDLPINIERLRKQWLADGLRPTERLEPAPDVGDNGSDKAPVSETLVQPAERSGNGSRSKQARRAPASEDAIEALREEVQRLKEAHLFELRSLKGLTLDIASVVCDLAERLTERKPKRPWYRVRRR